jgi:glycosyltransferase involved in cell wall biosynthesis
MKILVVTTSYPLNAVDHSGVFVKRLAQAMARKGGEVTLLAPGDRVAAGTEWEGSVKVVRFKYAPRFLMRIAYGNGGISENLRRSRWLFLLLPLFVLSLVLHVLALSRDCDLIHANWLTTGLFCLPAKWVRRRPLVITVRGIDFKGKRSLLLSFLGRRAEALTTVNEQWAGEIGRMVGRTVFFTPNGVEVSEAVVDLRKKFGLDAEVIALYVGVLSLRKGADILAETARRSKGAGACIQFLVVGPGRPEEFGLDLLSNVHWTGSLPPQEVLGLYGGCDIFLLPSRHEGRPNALLEAMAAGVPSVATNLPGVVEVLSDACGIVVVPEDANSFTEAVWRLADDRQRRVCMGESARVRIRELCLDWDTSATRYMQIFQEVCSCAGSRVS